MRERRVTVISYLGHTRTKHFSIAFGGESFFFFEWTVILCAAAHLLPKVKKKQNREGLSRGLSLNTPPAKNLVDWFIGWMSDVLIHASDLTDITSRHRARSFSMLKRKKKEKKVLIISYCVRLIMPLSGQIIQYKKHTRWSGGSRTPCWLNCCLWQRGKCAIWRQT